MENQEDYLAQDGKIHIKSSEEVFFNGEKLMQDFDVSETINEIIKNFDEADNGNIAIMNLNGLSFEGSIIATKEDEDSDVFIYIAIKNDDSHNVYLVTVGDLGESVEGRKPTPCRSHNVIDRRPKSQNYIVAQIETFFHNFWYCPYHL